MNQLKVGTEDPEDIGEAVETPTEGEAYVKTGVVIHHLSLLCEEEQADGRPPWSEAIKLPVPQLSCGRSESGPSPVSSLLQRLAYWYLD